MRMFAYIDSDGTVVGAEYQEWLNETCQEFEVDHFDQLVIRDGAIVVDRSIEDPRVVAKRQMITKGRMGEIREIIRDHQAEKELVAAGLETSTTLSDTEYRDLLTEFKTLKDSLS